MSSKTIQKWLKEKPNEKLMKVIKEKAYPYVQNLYKSKGQIGKTREILPGFIRHLGSSEPRFHQV